MDCSLILKNFLDGSGRLISYPAKYKLKIYALMYLASKFTGGVTYSEREINEILNIHHTFDDCCLMRRELFNKRFLMRQTNGTNYRLEEKLPELSDFGL